MLRISKVLVAGLGLANAGLDESKEIIVGLTEGFLSDKSDLKDCVQSTKRTVDDVESAVKDLKKKDAHDVLEGLRKLSDALKTGFPDALKDCKAVEADVKQVIDALESMHSPHEFVYHVGKDLVVNHEAIYEEITTAVKDYDAKKYEEFGVQVGLALHKLIVGAKGKFQEFVQFHNKSYSVSEFRSRLASFTENLKNIYHVQRMDEGSAHYSHLSPFADLSPEEFAERNGLLAFTALADENLELLDTEGLPASIDWVEKGAVNPVKNQGTCGSCWAFSTVANIEGAGFVTTGKLVSLSEQELVDCDKNGDQGCQGGLPSNAFEDMVKHNLGLELESAYPYKGRNGACAAQPPKEVAFIKGFKTISTDETQMAAALVQYGPLSIGINAGPMQWYMGGVAHPFKMLCNPQKIDHGVAIVGFGTQGKKDYWKIRNSWGVTWGEKGYYRIVRGVNACGLTSMVTTATGISFKKTSDSDSLFVV